MLHLWVLDMIQWIMSSKYGLLPSFQVIHDILMDDDEVEIIKVKKRKKKKRDENEWINEYKKDLQNAASSQMEQDSSIGIFELIELKAQQNNIEFYPHPNKKHDGKKVYKFGKLWICFYDKAIFAKCKDEWKPMDMQDLLRQC